MMRLYRSLKAKATLVPLKDDPIASVETLTNEIEQKIAELNSQLLGCKNVLATMAECPSKKLVKAKAVRLLKRRRVYKNQVQRLRLDSLLMKRAAFTAQNIANADVKAATKLKMSEKLSLLYTKIVKPNK